MGKDYTGQRFGKLLVVKSLGLKPTSRGGKRMHWLCLCDCGKEYETYFVNQIKSCGCEKAAVLERSKDRFRKHGLAESDGVRNPALNTWNNMISRCYRPYAKSYSTHGGRGITVCDRWRFGEFDKTGFQCFFLDMGEKPEGGYLDRIDNDLGYSPDNCRWVDSKISGRNKRNTIRVEYNGEIKALWELEEEKGVKASVLYKRIFKQGWSIEASVDPSLHNTKKGKRKSATPKKGKNIKTIEYNGSIKSVAEWGSETGLGASVINMRLRAGWDVKKVLETPLLRQHKP